MVTVTPVGDNPSYPFAGSKSYYPDQLIAGDLHLVTGNALITGGALLKRGTLLGMATVGLAPTVNPPSSSTGNGVISAVSLGPEAKAGTYTVEFTGATTYNVLDPDGHEMAPGVAAGAYGVTPANPEIHFTFTAGTTPMVAGDHIAIVVGQGSGSYRAAVGTAADGSEAPCAILADDVDATGGDVMAGVYLAGEFNANKVILDPSLTVAGVTNALRAFNIYLKSAVSAADPT